MNKKQKTQEVQKNQQKQKEPGLQPEQNLSPNLLASKDRDYTKGTSLLIKLIIALQLLFLVVVGVNFVLNQRLEDSVLKTVAAKDLLQSKSHVYDEFKLIDQKTAVYRKVGSSRNKISERLLGLVNNMPPGTEVVGVSLESGSTQLSVISPSALEAALFMSNLVEKEKISQVILESATLNTTKGTYRIQLELVY